MASTNQRAHALKLPDFDLHAVFPPASFVLKRVCTHARSLRVLILVMMYLQEHRIEQQTQEK